jgi:hypothetical protein
MDPRIVLKKIIERHASEVEGIGHVDFSGWEEEGDEEGGDWPRIDPRIKQLTHKGKLHLAEAVLEAQAALASGDEARIADAALICQTLVATAKGLATTSQRRAGGEATGRLQRDAAAEERRKYLEEYQRKVADGVPYLVARRQVRALMVRDAKAEN